MSPRVQSPSALGQLTLCTSVQPVKQLVFSSTSSKATPSPSDLYHLSVSLLASLTSHAAPPPPTSFTPFLQPSSSTPLLDLLESKLGPTSSSAVRAVRSSVGYLYGGASARGAVQGGRDWSVKGAVNGVTSLVLDYVTPSKRQTRKAASGAEGWRSKLEALGGLKGGSGMLDEAEVEEGMEEVVSLAYRAAEAGSAEAWVLLANLHLVSCSSRRNITIQLTSLAHHRRDTSASVPIPPPPSKPTPKRPKDGARPKLSTSSAFSTAATLEKRSTGSRAQESKEAYV